MGAKPAWWCWMNGELADHRQGNLKILLLFVMCAGLVIGEGWLLTLAFG